MAVVAVAVGEQSRDWLGESWKQSSRRMWVGLMWSSELSAVLTGYMKSMNMCQRSMWAENRTARGYKWQCC